MITWNNLDKLASYQELEKTESVDLAAVMPERTEQSV